MLVWSTNSILHVKKGDWGMFYCQHFSLQGDESLTFLATELKFTRMLSLINFLQNTKPKVKRKKERKKLGWACMQKALQDGHPSRKTINLVYKLFCPKQVTDLLLKDGLA